MGRKRFAVIGLLISAVFLFLRFNSPDSVVVSEKGEIDGMVNRLREKVQGKRFWRSQLNQIDESIAFASGFSDRVEKMRREARESMAPIHDEVNREMEDFYRDNPQFRPSIREQQAQQLERAADRIRQEEQR